MALVGGFVIQAAALIVLFSKVHRSWSQHLGALFIILAVTYHGLGEMLYRLFPDQNTYRLNVSGMAQENFFVAISIAILLLTIAYVAILRAPKTTHPLDVEELRYYFDWRIMLALSAPLLVWTLAGSAGQGAGGNFNNAQRQSASSGLTDQFLLIALTMTGVALYLRFGRRMLVPILLVEAAILASLGQRGDVVIALVMMLYALTRVGFRPSRRWLAGAGVFALLAIVVLTSTRAAVGRESFEAGNTAGVRFGAIGAGISNIFSQDTLDGLYLTASYRLDGNAFPALVLDRYNQGLPGMGLAPLVNNARLAVPSALDPQKLDLPLEVRSEKYFAQRQLNLPLRDSLYTQLGGTVGYYGLPGLLVIALVMGALLGRLDVGLLAGPTPKRLLIGVGALNAIAYYSASLDHWFVNARGVALLLLGLWVLQVMRSKFGRSASLRSGPGQGRPSRRRPVRPSQLPPLRT